MNKFITLAALGLCFSSINAQEAKEEKKAEEGFVEPFKHLLVFLICSIP